MKSIKNESKIVVIGGGTGSFVVLSGIKKYFSNITALVSMADDGGSTGQLRDEYGALPAGDVRQCLVALSRSPKLRDLFNYRFEDGSLGGHSFGNIFITTLEKLNGSFAEAIYVAGRVLNIEGGVVPTTLDSVTLCLNDGEKTICHERNIREESFKPRPKVWLEPNPVVNPEAVEAIKKADFVVIAPGGLYESLGAALKVPGIGKALKNTKAKIAYICNLMNKTGHTDGFSAYDYADELERLAGAKFLDYVIFNKRQPDKKLLEIYAADGELPVVIPKSDPGKMHYKMVGANLLADEIWQNSSKGDILAHQRSLIRHNPDLIAKSILKEIKK